MTVLRGEQSSITSAVTALHFSEWCFITIGGNTTEFPLDSPNYQKLNLLSNKSIQEAQLFRQRWSRNEDLPKMHVGLCSFLAKTLQGLPIVTEWSPICVMWYKGFPDSGLYSYFLLHLPHSHLVLCDKKAKEYLALLLIFVPIILCISTMHTIQTRSFQTLVTISSLPSMPSKLPPEIAGSIDFILEDAVLLEWPALTPDALIAPKAGFPL